MSPVPLPRDPELTLPAPVLVVEDDSLMRERIRHLLLELGYEAQALWFTTTVKESLALIDSEPVALALVDIGLPDGNGETVIARLREQDPGVAILVISAWSTEDVILSALRAGATGYVLKERDDLEIILSIRSALRGGAPIDPFIAKRLLEVWPASSSPAQPAVDASTPGDGQAPLTAREREILDLVSHGLSNREIAGQLHLSKYTVECHIKHVYRKLAVSSRTRAIATARSRGLLG